MSEALPQATGRWGGPQTGVSGHTALLLFSSLLTLASMGHGSSGAGEPAASGLEFPVEEQVVEVGFLPRSFWVDFAFTVDGSSAVTIKNFSSSCPCTAIALDRLTYYPGQKGAVVAVYEYRGETEPEVQVIEVLTDQAPVPQRLRVVPRRAGDAIWVDRRELHWIAGRERQAQSVEVEVAPEFRQGSPAVKIAVPGWRTRIEPGPQVGIWRLTIEPVSDHPEPAEAVLSVAVAGPEAAAVNREIAVALFPVESGG